MRLFILHLLLGILISTGLYAQPDWQLVSGGPSDVTGFQLLGENKVIAGNYGDENLYLTDNSGITWQSIAMTYNPVPTAGQMQHRFFFLNDNEGWASIRTTNYYTYLFHTNDGGLTWTQRYVTDALSSESFSDIYFKDANRGWALNGWIGELWETNDGGATWAVQHDASSSSAYLNQIQFLDANIAVVTGYNATLRSTDGGDTWTEHPHNYTLNAAYFFSTTNGVSSSFDYGKQFVTNDGGITWTPGYEDAVLPQMYDLTFRDAQTAYWVGGQECRLGGCHNEPYVQRSTDGGQTWSYQTHDVPFTANGIKDIEFTAGGNGWMGSTAGMLRNFDATLSIEQSPNTALEMTIIQNDGTLTITHEGLQNGTITIVNSLGQLVEEGRATAGQTVLPVSDLRMGVYIITLTDGKQMVNEKVVLR